MSKLNNIDIPNWDAVYQSLSWWKTEQVSNAKIMVVGAGAIGNEVLKNLALLNIGNILIIDFDHIEYSNLSRSVLFREEDCKSKNLKVDIAASRVREINPNVKVMTINGDVMIDVGLGVFRRMDVIIGCLDNRLARLFLNRSSFKTDKVWIDGAIENLIGQVNPYKREVACYECALRETEWEDIQVRLGCADVAMRNISSGRIPTTPISSSIVAAIQVQEALKIIHGYTKQSMVGSSFYYEGMNNLILQLDAEPLKEECDSHDYYEDIIEAPLSNNDTFRDTLAWLGEYFQDEKVTIGLDHSIVLKISTQISNKVFEIFKAKPHISEDFLNQYRSNLEEVYFLEEENYVDIGFKFIDYRLADAGIPPLHILQVYQGGKRHFVELSKDESFINFQ